MRSAAERAARLQRLLPLLACPACGGELQSTAVELTCRSCHVAYPVLDGVPVLLSPELRTQGLGIQLGADDNISKHPYSPASEALLDQHRQGWVLDLGAGGKGIGFDHVVQVDVFRFPMVDVVASADSLPFKANAFDAVISQAVFEHLQYPDAAAEEVRRVLKLGGAAKIDTAFLQPEHAYPHHYFNATEGGLKHWFRNFDIQWSGVEPYQHPMWSLVWFLSDYLVALGDNDRTWVEQRSVREVLDALSRTARGCATDADAVCIQALQRFVQPDAMRRLAAGVSVLAVKQLPMDARVASTGGAVVALEQRAQQLQQRLQSQGEWLSMVAYSQRLAADRSRWLSHQWGTQAIMDGHLRAEIQARDQTIAKLLALQIAPPLPVLFRWWLVATSKKWLPQRWVQALQNRDRQERPISQLHAPATPDSERLKPVPGDVAQGEWGIGATEIHIHVEPLLLHDVLDQFFSLVYQTHQAWRLFLHEVPAQSEEIRLAMQKLMSFDRRVEVCAMGAIPAIKPGSWQIRLPGEVKLPPGALLEVFNMALNRSEIDHVVGDSLSMAMDGGESTSIRCLAGDPRAEWSDLDTGLDLSTWPVFSRAGARLVFSGHGGNLGRIPKVLFYRWSVPQA